MRSRELIKQHEQIKRLIQETKTSTNGNLELQGHWGKYLCVLVSGFLENSICEVYIEFVNTASAPHVTQYTRTALSKIQNPKAAKFVDTARQFKKEWGQELETFFIEDSSRKDAIDSIMQNRHLIAHGKSSSISVARVSEYLQKSIEVIEFMENQCFGQNVNTQI